MEEKEDVKVAEESPKKKSLIKKLFKILLYIVLGFVALNVLLYFLLSIPFVQQKAKDFAINELKSKLQTEVAIDELRLSLFNQVTLKGIYIGDQAKDTLLHAKELDVTLSPWELIKNNKLAITGISLDDFLINVNKRDSVSDFNFQFIIDAFASKDTTQVSDTTKGGLMIVIENIRLNRGQLNYDVLSDSVTPHIFNASHISLFDFNAKIDLNSIDADKFDIALNSLSAKEKSGLEITGLQGRLYSDKSQLWVEGLSLTLPNSHLKTQKARYNLASGEFEVATEDTEIDTKDLVAFLPNLKFFKHKINLYTSIKGTLPQINVDSIRLLYGEDFYLLGKANIANYERYGDADLNLFIDKLKATPSAVTSFARLGDSTFVAPDILCDLGDLYLKGNVSGRLSKLKINAETWNRHGLISLSATGAVDTTFTNFNVAANLNTRNFNLGRLLKGTTGLGRLTTHINVQAKQTEKEPLSATLFGAIDGLDYKEETIKRVPFSAFYNAKSMGLKASADWSIGKIWLDAEMSQAKEPDVSVRLRVDTLQLDRFYKNEDWINPRLTVALNGKIKGLDIDKMTGWANVDSLDFHGDNFSFVPGRFAVEAGKKEDESKYINITSSLLSASIAGQYSFLTLSDGFANLMHHFLPNVFLETKQTKKARKEQNNFTFDITANNTENLGRIFALPLDIIQPASLKGRINMDDNRIDVRGNIPHVRYGNMDIKRTAININNNDSIFYISGNSRVYMDKGNYNIVLNVDGSKNLIHSAIDVKSDSTDISIDGKIEALAQFDRNEEGELVSSLRVTPSDIMIGKLALNLFPAEIVNVGERIEINNVGIGLNKKKYFGMDGVISRQETDSLRAYFNHAEVGELLEAFDVKNIEGCLHGNILLTNLLNQPELYTQDFEIADIVVYGDTLGTLNMESMWSDDFGGARLNATLDKGDINYAEIDGTVYTNQDSLDLQLQMDRLPLGWTQPFLTGLLNKISGSLSTNLMISGSTKAPKLRGFIGFNEMQLGIDYTNVLYTVSDTIRVSPDRIGLDDLTLRDSKGNTAKVNATVTHKNFDNMKYSLNMNMDKLMVLNTEHRTDSLFYGQVFASGTVKIDGDDNGIKMNMRIKNEKNSKLNILLPQRSEASDYKSVVYINVPEDKLKEEEKNGKLLSRKDPQPINLSVVLEVTPDLTIGVVMDPATGDALQDVKGKGTITFNYDMLTDNMSARGDYTLSDGNVRLNLQNIKTLQFRIQDGSKLFFIGDPLKTKFDITAYRTVRPYLKSLDASFGENGSARVNVNCILDISGNMDKMDVSYNISLPSVDEDIQRKVNSLISTDEEKIKQFAALVATGNFYPSGSSSGTNFTQGLWTGLASSTLSSGLTSLVGNMLGDKWQIGANVEASDGNLNNMDMTVNVQRTFFDDKLTFKTNLGYRTEQTSTNDNFIGDFDLEYELNNMWTLRAYSHTNDQYYKQAQTTQGVGIVYNKEAATLKRLFQSFKPRRFRRLQDNVANPSDSTSQSSDSTKIILNRQPVINDEDKSKGK